MVTHKISAIKRIIFSASATLITQRHEGMEADTLGYGQGDIKDMVLVARAMKQSYDRFMDSIQQMAAETGDLHALQEIRDALDALEPQNAGN